MGINLAQKRLSTSSMLCTQTAQVTLSLAASNDVTANPVDIMLVLDRSGSMAEKTDPHDPLTLTKIAALKDAAKEFTQIIANASTSTTPPPDSNALAEATAEATITRNDGIIIYAIGLGEDASQANLETWTADPARVLMAPSTADLEAAFKALAANIINPAPQNISVVDTLEDNFEIVGPVIPLTPTGITVNYTLSADRKSITWTLSSLGLTEPQTASISYGIRYTGTVNGTFPVNKNIVYDDTTTLDPTTVHFVSNGNTITLICDNIITPDCDFACKPADVPCCGGVVDVVMQNPTSAYDIQCDGTILNIITRFRNIYPNRKLAIGVVVCSTVNGVEEPPIFRITTINTPNSRYNCDCQDFAVPMEILLPPSENSCADQRQVKVRVIAHYLANSFSPCLACFTK